MMAIEDIPTPAPMREGEVDSEDAPTAVYSRTILPPPKKTLAKSSSPSAAETPPNEAAVEVSARGITAMTTTQESIQAPETRTVERMSSPEAPIVRDTIVDPPPPPSLWSRFKTGCSRFADAMSAAFFGATIPLSDELPPVPKQRELHSDTEYGEYILLALLRAPRRYQRAATLLLLHALGARRGSADDYTDFVVHCALSRMRADKQGRLGVIRLRELLPHLPYLGTVMPSLARLEERGLVKLILDTSSGDPMTEIQRENITHIELLVPV